jgi:hypothetical protein
VLLVKVAEVEGPLAVATGADGAGVLVVGAGVDGVGAGVGVDVAGATAAVVEAACVAVVEASYQQVLYDPTTGSPKVELLHATEFVTVRITQVVPVP